MHAGASTGSPITYQVSPTISNDDLNALFATAWPDYQWRDFQLILHHSLVYICAVADAMLIGFVNVAWDGGAHAFLLDTTVHHDWQRRGIGRRLVHHAAQQARERGLQWLHVDYEPHLDPFYRTCGFAPTLAGVMWLPA